MVNHELAATAALALALALALAIMAAEFDLTSLTGKGYNDQTVPLPIFIV
ncbi:conserved hypothetical protein [Vibrio crassostreae]|uniref:Uncharacterized protein n=1 Tax=Vibrio crassostreae TaxID=246167 RepID=A0ABP1WPN8_9VIBR|nr:conserved hypothetical protein [Vibrio crassostreae]CAK1847734.1 conserved hypothetical protein [Vibrio crassostreae]CAK1853717.1 conserved hypothetical protein [Vibrio crassostreae]CAK1854848.1 conserved hypothetical protein [Vibrio crassostreae]CAK1906604.1 conserved hypothetical protein [Vibrio crassostreae]